jgi:hypothetical protein
MALLPGVQEQAESKVSARTKFEARGQQEREQPAGAQLERHFVQAAVHSNRRKRSVCPPVFQEVPAGLKIDWLQQLDGIVRLCS